MKEGPFKAFDQEEIEKAEDLFFKTIKHNKDRSWERIEERLPKKKLLPLWIYYAAASLLLIMGLSFIFIHLLDSKNKEIAELKRTYKTQELKAENTAPVYNQIVQRDTVKITQKEIIRVPVNRYDTLIIHDTISTFVVQKDTLILKEKNQGNTNEKKMVFDVKLNKNQSIDNINTKEKRKKGFIIRFGKQKNETSGNEEPTLITLRTK